MTTAYSTLMGLAEPVQGELSGTWGDTVNKGITEYLDIALAGTQTISGSQTAVTLSLTNGDASATNIAQAGSGSTGSAQYALINCTGNPAALLTVTVPASSRQYIVINATSTSQSVKIVGAGPTTGVTLVSGEKAVVAWNGTDYVKVASSVADGVTSVGGTGTVNGITLTGTVTSTGNLTLGGALSGVSLTTQVTGTLPVANGGSGATDASGARTNFGATTVGSNLFTLTNPSAITFPRFNADNTVSALNAADFRTAIGVGTGTGTVTSVDVSGGTTGLTTSGGPVTGSGTITIAGTLAVANGGTGATSASSARTNLGATTIGGSMFTLTNPSAITFPQFNANNTVSALDAATFRSAIGAGTGSGDVTTTGVQTLTNKTISAGTFTDGYTEEVATANTGTAYTINLSNGSVQNLTLTGSCTFTFPTATAGRSFLLLLRQDGTGSRTVTWPASVRWPGGTAPTITSTASKVDKFVFTADGTSWFGSTAGQNYSA